MANTLSPINPLEYITHHDPVPQMVRDPRGWFAVEYMKLTIGEYVGRPDTSSVMKIGIVQYLVAEGWRIDSVENANSYGSWKNTTHVDRVGSQIGNGTSSSNTEGNSSSNTTGNNTTNVTGSNTSSTSGENASTITQTHQTSDTTTHTGTDTTTHGGTDTTTHTGTDMTKADGTSSGTASSSSSSSSKSSATSIPWLDTRKASSEGDATAESTGASSSNTNETSTTVHDTTNTLTRDLTDTLTRNLTDTVIHSGTDSTVNNGNSSSQTEVSNLSNTIGSNSSNTTGNSTSKTNGTTSSNSVSSSTDDNVSESSYWSASIVVSLSRRRLQSDKIMKDMLEDLTLAYNEGRKINDDRYDEIVSLYSIMLGRNEEEGNNFILQTSDLKPLTDAVLASMKKSINDFHAVADNLADDVFKNRVKMINLKFDNELSTSRATLITAGLYNSTTWITTSAGIERNREMALNDLIETKIDIYVKVANAGTEIGNKFMDSAARIQAMTKERLLSPAETRNNVFKWMLDFMERRKDLFPTIDQVAGAAKQFGSGDMAVANAK